MTGKPLLIAVATFVIVLFGGAALAGVGFGGGGSDDAALDDSADTDLLVEVPDWTTTTVLKESMTDEAVTRNVDAPQKGNAPEGHETKAAEEPLKTDRSDVAKDQSDVGVADRDLFTLTKPEDGAKVTSKVVAFGGEAEDGVTVHRGKYSVEAVDGTWTMELVVSPGKNHVGFKAIDADGNLEEAAVTVFYDAPAEDKGDKGDVEFSAGQKYGSCGDDVPYDVFFGTAAPGTKVTAHSDFGSGSATANDDGRWKIKVEFPGAPVGMTFKVTVNASTGQSETFGFTNTQNGGHKDH